MNPVSQKTAMYCFLDRTVAEYIKCLFGSTKHIQKIKLEDLVERITGDIELIKDYFREYMTARDMKKSFDILGDLVNILSSDPDFLSMAFSQLR